jgi:energy-coupling factor transporter ATP-binding protein EcfA2
MKIDSVRIENFRCFEKLDLSFEKCQALIGENGSGKTAVLEALGLATSRSAPASRLSERDFHIADRGDLRIEVCFSEPFILEVPDGYATKAIPCDRVVLSAHRRDKAAPGTAFSGPIVAQQLAVPIVYEAGHAPAGLDADIPAWIKKTESGYQVARKTAGKPMELGNRQLSLQNDTDGFPNIFYFGRDREKESKVGFGSLLGKIAKDLNWRFRKSWNQGSIAATWDAFYQTVLSGLEIPKTDRIIQPLRERMKEFFGREFRDLELSLIDIEQPFAKAFFSRRNTTNQIEQADLGSGVSILLAYFLLEIVSKLSKEQFIILIDEPELHLHPQLQQRLFTDFQQSAFQVIYTTHSDIFVDLAEWRSIKRFSPQGITPTVAALEKAFAGQPVQEHLDEIKTWYRNKSLYFREDNQLFFSRRCLLVEGPAEKYGIPVLAEKLGKDIGHVTIMACNGKTKIPDYQLLCCAFGIPFFTLYDLDGKPTTEDGNKRIAECAAPGACGAFSTSFEQLLGISTNAAHKASVTLSRVDAIPVAEVHPEITAHVEAISRWSTDLSSVDAD